MSATQNEFAEGVEKPITQFECRTCLKIIGDGNSNHLFQLWTSPWNPKTKSIIAQDLTKLSGVEVLEADSHSKLICQKCCLNLYNACQFITSTKASDQLLKERQVKCELPKEFMGKPWPKPIQVDKEVNSGVFGRQVEVEIKQEVMSEEEQFNSDGVDPETDETPQIKVTVNGTISLAEMGKHSTIVTNGSEIFEDVEKSPVKQTSLAKGKCGKTGQQKRAKLIDHKMVDVFFDKTVENKNVVIKIDYNEEQKPSSSKNSESLKNSEQNRLPKTRKTSVGHQLRPPCHEACIYKCRSSITEEQRRQIHKEYWDLGVEDQCAFIVNNVERVAEKYNFNKNWLEAHNKSIRGFNHHYYFTISSVKIRVCKMFFRNTLAIHNRLIIDTLNNKHVTRTKYKIRKLNESIESGIIAFIKTLPIYDTDPEHNTRRIESIVKLHAHYVNNCKSKNDIYANYMKFYRIYNQQIKSFKLKKERDGDASKITALLKKYYTKRNVHMKSKNHLE